MAVRNSSRFDLSEGIQDAIVRYLEDYSEEVIVVTEKVVKEIAEESVRKLKEDSPRSERKTKHQYAKGWTYDLDKRRLRAGATIYGKKGTYNLAHLLEFGHALKIGGRDTGKDTSPIPHIKPVEQWAIQEFERRLKNELDWRIT